MGGRSWEMGAGSWEMGDGRSTHPTLIPSERLRQRAHLSCRFFYSEGTSVGVASPTGDIKPPLRWRSLCLSRGGDFPPSLPVSQLPTPNSQLSSPNSQLPTPNSHLPSPISHHPLGLTIEIYGSLRYLSAIVCNLSAVSC